MALVHVDAVILLFDPTFNLSNVRPRRHTTEDTYYLRPHARIVLGILREAGQPLTTAEIKYRVMSIEGLGSGLTVGART